MRRFLRYLVWLVGIACVAILAIIGYVQWRYASHVVPIEKAHAPYAIILGASVTRARQPSDALRDRLDVGIDLWKRGSVEKLFITGDDGSNQVDEVSVMRDYLLNQGVSSTQIIVDEQGYRTYESCKRAKTLFGIDEAVIVTQRFHLGRALYLCEHFGMKTQGVSADLRPYVRVLFFTARDLLSSFKAWWDVSVRAPSAPVTK
ncbi:MAG: ElyC/SanA/YdcF family protein [bacterium]|nr:ElyC/SanA/YdcF family protein [bacterium]